MATFTLDKGGPCYLFMSSYAPNWNPCPAREASIRLEALQCREMLAPRLGVHLAMPQEAV
ncbi:hypothetical protein LU640_05015 [Pseudomonas monteilii]|uniref:hypothetical protein n=1 Tax=Pseudomonas monteilii TaxID=76759 RepID=UPI001E46DCB6|nr:hypothetical protein [Pseudomonas monteilii]MCE1033874.1 hypothetical protein [Pseudomonas monteilii]MCE1086014.1 hypothetical protein [Pseudomonas monteilii]